MKIKTYIFLILSLIVLEGCLNMNSPEDQANYIKCYNSFDSKLIDIIPNKIPNSFVSYGYSSPKYFFYDYAGMHITTKISDEDEYNKLREKYSEKAKAIKNSSDKCLIIITTSDNELEEGVQGNFNCEQPIPIPQYAIFKPDGGKNNINRIKNLEIIVLDFQFTDILNSADLTERKNLPEELSKGYSKGVTINKNNMTIQKWVVFW
ncbi:hypothetical protein [Psychroflexus aestuariivivens]|uniref:hypothetical protein n=1 Tax=Psychroflexus aestuariivivens TaxID=1795040 RepID=UPI000FD8BA1E|nr:hypothetical protein [Psychroflexus aestuariivivens]